MAGAGKSEYWFELKMRSADALTHAKEFKKALTKELQDINAAVNLTISGGASLTALLKGAEEVAPKVAAPFEKALDASIGSFEASVKRFGAAGYTQQFRSMWDEGVIKPSQRSVASIRNATAAINNFGQATRKMGVGIDEWANMGGLDRWITAIQAAQRRIWGLRGFGYQMESYGRSLVRTTLAVGAAAGVAGKEYLDFADPLNRAARNLDLNVQLTEELSDELRRLDGEFEAFTPEEQAGGLYLWAAATGAVIDNAGELYDTLSQVDDVQKLAKLGAVSYGQAVEATTDILAQYQKNVSETESVVATLVKVAAVSKAEVGDLAQAFTFAGARADNANTSFEQTAAAFQLLSAYGIRGSRAGRGLGMLFDNLIAPSKEAKAILDELFEDAFGRTDVLVNARGEFVGLAEAVRLLNDAMAELTPAERDATVARITSQNAARVLIPLLKMEAAGREHNIDVMKEMEFIISGVESEHRDAFKQMMADTQGYEVDTASALETLDRYWEQYQNSITGRMDNVRATFSKAMTTLGEAVIKAVLPALEAAVDMLGDLATAAKENEGLVKAVLGGLAGVGLVGGGLIAGGRAIRLVADVKTILMAKSMRDAANKNMSAATTMLIASENNMRAAGLTTGGRVAQAAQGAAQAGGGIMGAFGVGGSPALGGVVQAGGSALGSLAIGVGVPLAAIAGVIALTNHLADLYDARVRDSAEIAVQASSYDEYMQMMADAGLETQALTEDIYDLIQAKKDDLDAKGMSDLAQQTQEAREGVKDLLDIYIGGRAKIMGEDPIEAITESLILMAKEADASQISMLRSGDYVKQWAMSLGWTEDEADRLVERIRQVIFAQEALSAVTMGADYRIGLEETGDAAAEAEDEIEAALAAAAEAAEEYEYAWQQVADRLSPVIDAHQELRSELEMQLGKIRQLIGWIPGLAGVYALLESALDGVDSSMQRLRFTAVGAAIESGAEGAEMSLEKLAEAANAAADQGFGRFEKLAEAMPTGEILSMYDEYIAGLKAIYAESGDMTARQLQLELAAYNEHWDGIVDGYLDAEKDATKATEDAIRERERLYEQAESGFRSLVEKALQPTAVTQEDVWATEAGNYKDKWDEAARQMRAAMEAPGGEWGFLIPEDVRAQGDEQARIWGARWVDEFYAGMHPEAIKWDAFVRDFQTGLQREMGKKALVETAIQKLAEEGITATSEEVMIALGLRSPLETMLLGSKTPAEISEDMKSAVTTSLGGVQIAEEDVAAFGGMVSDAIFGGVGTNLDAKPFTSTLVTAWGTDVTDNAASLQGLGRMVGEQIWIGFEESVKGATFVQTIVDHVLEIIKAAIEWT